MKTKDVEQFSNNHQIENFDAVLDKMFGQHGTLERTEAEERAYTFYSGQIIGDIRKQVKMTQSELANKIGTSKTYISRVEHGNVEPKVSTFYKIVNALGYNVVLSV